MSHFKKFLRDRGALRINESSDVVGLTLAADREPEEDTPFLVGADALQEAGYTETADYVRFCISNYQFAGSEGYRGNAFAEIKNKALGCELEVSSATKPNNNSIIFYKLKDKTQSLPQPVGTIENYMTVVKYDMKISLQLVDLITSDFTSTTSSKSVDFEKFLQSVDYDKRNLFCATAMFLAVKSHAGVSSGNRVMKNLTTELSNLVSFDPGRNPNYNAITRIAGMTQDIWIAFKQIESQYPEKKKQAAQIIRNTLMPTRWGKCLKGRATNMPMYCAHFLRLREIIEQNP